MTSGCGDDSESPHPCCYTPNKVETIYRTLEDIPYILQWAAGEISSKIAFFPGDAVLSGMPGSPVAVRTGASLRSADVSTCVVPRTLSSYGCRTFAAAVPRLRNSLPVQLRDPDIIHGLFPTTAEGTPFTGSMNTALCDF